MNRSLLSFFSVVMLSASSLTVSANEFNSANSPTSTDEARAQIEQKRDEISGADKVAKPAKQEGALILDAPIETDDAPAQTQQK